MSNDPITSEIEHFHPIALRALEMIAAGSAIGLGTGHAATAFLHALGERVKSGFAVRGVPTSQATANYAASLGIALTTLEAENGVLEVDVDGADEVDPQGNLIKGYGGALVREKIVATAAKKLVILVGPEKLVPVLGGRGKLPVEVTPFGLPVCEKQLTAIGCTPQLRRNGQQPFVTDNGNWILDCGIGLLPRPEELQRDILAIPGVVGTGLFLQMRPTVLIQRDNAVEMR